MSRRVGESGTRESGSRRMGEGKATALKDNGMLKLKESHKVEFKTSFGKEVIISLVAFANAQGGKVIIGMSDDGRVIVAIGDAMLFIKKHITLAYEFDGGLERKEKWEYPLEAIRELLLNAVVHRDYKQASDIVIKIFDDRIIFTSPGKLYGGLKIEDLARDDYVSSIRNKLVAEAFYLMGDIEKYGTGFIRIRRQLIDYPGAGFHMSEVGDFFRVELSKTTQKTTQKKSLREQILQLIAENPKISQREAAEALGLSFNTVKEYFTMLKKENRIKRLGGRKEGYWEILE